MLTFSNLPVDQLLHLLPSLPSVQLSLLSSPPLPLCQHSQIYWYTNCCTSSPHCRQFNCRYCPHHLYFCADILRSTGRPTVALLALTIVSSAVVTVLNTFTFVPTFSNLPVYQLLHLLILLPPLTIYRQETSWGLVEDTSNIVFVSTCEPIWL